MNKKIVFLVVCVVCDVFGYGESKKCLLNISGCLNSALINARKGPGKEYPIACIYKRKYLPVKIVAEFNNWYQIEDQDGIRTWVSKNLISKRKTVVIKNSNTIFYKSANIKSVKLARLEKGVIGIVEKNIDKNFVKIKINTIKGWVLKNDVYGVDE